MKTLSIFSLLIFILTGNYLNAQTGTIYGIVLHSDKNEPIPLVNIIIKGTNTGSATDFNGRYELTNIQSGTYVIVASAVGHKTEEKEVTLSSGEQARVDFTLSNTSVEVGEVLVYGASLRRERITEAPASVSIIGMEEIRRKSAHGQVARLLENEPGVDVTQSGLFDFNINTRGFNSSLNRRLLILLDGRDIGTAFLGATEWNGLSIPLEDLGRIELVRGPGSALYGANAYNGVINISTITPKSNPGTRISVGGGERASVRGDIKHAGITGQWSYRINAGAYQGKSFAISRLNNTFEYEGLQFALNNEVIPLITDPVRSIYGSARIDYDFQDGSVATAEGGLTQVENEVIVTGIGRVQVQNATKPYGRINYNGHGFNFLVWSNGRYNVKPERSLSTGLDLIQNALITHAEVQYNFSISDFFIVAGASHRLIGIDTDGTLMLEKRNDNMSSLFSQIEYRLADNLKVVGAARWDRSSLHDSKISPKLALVWTFESGHSLRATFNQAFQPANYSEQYLYVKRPLAPGAKRSILYLGSPGLVPEEITGYELGYKGIFSNQIFVTIDFYYSHLKQFITDLGPTGRSIAEFNDVNDPNDDIVYDIWSYYNAGKVDEYGTEVSANYHFSDYWMINGNFSLFKFNVLEKGSNDILIPNTPEYKINFGLAYSNPVGHGAEINFKYIPEFPWAAGIYRDANVKAYTVVNLAGTYHLSNLLSLNLNIVNVLDNRHYEILGGSLLGRRAIITATATF